MTKFDAEPILREICPPSRPTLAFKLMTTPQYRRFWAKYIKFRHYAERRGKYVRSLDPIADEEIGILRAEVALAVRALGYKRYGFTMTKESE